MICLIFLYLGDKTKPSPSSLEESALKNDTDNKITKEDKLPAQKQSKEPQTYILDKITTTATGFATALIEEQRNIVVVEKEHIQNKGYQTLEDALQNTQATFTYNGFNAPNIDIRGQGGTASRAVKILRNAIPINLQDSPYAYSSTPINALDINNIERIEIIPGGGAVLYGNGTRGGSLISLLARPLRILFGSFLKALAGKKLGFKAEA